MIKIELIRSPLSSDLWKLHRLARIQNRHSGHKFRIISTNARHNFCRCPKCKAINARTNYELILKPRSIGMSKMAASQGTCFGCSYAFQDYIIYHDSETHDMYELECSFCSIRAFMLADIEITYDMIRPKVISFAPILYDRACCHNGRLYSCPEYILKMVLE